MEAAKAGDITAVYLLGADEIDAETLKDTFVIYQGHHGDAGAHVADVVLPGASYAEKSGTYVNTEGRVQRGNKAAFPPGDAREDWTIIRALSESVGKTLPYNDIETLRERMAAANSVFANLDELQGENWAPFGIEGPVNSAAFASPIENFFMTDPISRASETMARCTAVARGEAEPRTGTDG